MSVIVCLKHVKHGLQRLEEKLRYYLYSNVFKLVKVHRNKIILNNFYGKGYGDNPKYIADEIIKQGLPYDLVWVVKERDTTVPDRVRTVRRGSIREAYEFATAKVIISNVKRKYPFYKKKGQYYIQTWHGCFMLKYIEAEVEKKLSARYVRESRKDSAITALMLSGSGLASEVMHQSFWYSGEVYECGQPRDDIFFHCTAEEIRELKKKHRLPQDVKIAVYAPTFRDGDESYPYDMIDVKAVMDGLHQKGSSEWVMVIRLHPNVACQSARFQYGEKVLDGSKYTDPQELFLMADLLITDYSSVMMDFGLMKKPVFLFVPDLEVYKRARGVRGFFEDLPFPRCRSNEELENAILSFDELSYQKALKCFTETYYRNFSDGHASERVVERIKQVINGTDEG